MYDISPRITIICINASNILSKNEQHARERENKGLK